MIHMVPHHLQQNRLAVPGPRVASGVVRKWPLRLPEEEPPVEEFTPVFIEAWMNINEHFGIRVTCWELTKRSISYFFMVL